MLFRLAKTLAKITSKSTWGRLDAPANTILAAISDPAGPPVFADSGRFCFSCLTTPDTGRRRRILHRAGFQRGCQNRALGHDVAKIMKKGCPKKRPVKT